MYYNKINTIEDRAKKIAVYVLETGQTVREAAKHFNVSKSTIHKDLSDRLKDISPSLAKQVQELLKQHKNERHIRGGMATKQKYMQKKINDSKILVNK
ncbi:MAG: sporulation transcriptional regulator SpoIIID [Clostridia bacterium]|nr:sporulation transcriptional regulator SpoIIID [Clostridia bacterium]